MKKIQWIILSIVLLVAIYTGSQLIFDKPQVVNKEVFKHVYSFEGHNHIVQSVKFSPDGQHLISGGVDSAVQIWDRRNGKVNQILMHPSGITYLDVSPDGKFIATSSYDSKVRLWKLPEGKVQWEGAAHVKTPWTVAISPDGQFVASAGEEGIIHFYNMKDGRLYRSVNAHDLNIWSIQFSPDGKQLASGSFDKQLKLWDVESGLLLKSIKAHDQAIVALAYSHNGRLIATASDDKTTKLWDAQNGLLVKILIAGDEHVQAVAFSPKDNFLIAGGRDRNMIGEFLQEFTGDAKKNKGVSFRLWDIHRGKVVQTFSKHGNDVTDLDFSPDGKTIASSSADKTVHIWSLKQFENP